MTFAKCNPERSVTVLARFKTLKAKHTSGLMSDAELFDRAYRFVWTEDLADTLLFKQRMGLK